MPIIEYFGKTPSKKKKETLGAMTEKAVKQLLAALVSLVIVFSVTLLTINSKKQQSSYSISQKQLENEQLKNFNEQITNKITRSTSIQALLQDENVKAMIKLQEPNFISEEDNKI